MSKESNKRWKQTSKLICNGVQTLSKAPDKHVQGIYPTYIESADGCYIYNGMDRYIDYPLGLGAILLGHNYPAVNDSIQQQLLRGITFSIFSMLSLITKNISNIFLHQPCTGL